VVKAVVVSWDAWLVARDAETLRGAGYAVETCGGPRQEPCPVLGNLPCPLVDGADVLVYDAWAAGDSEAARRLIGEVRETYPDLPVVLTSVDSRIDWVVTEGPTRVTPVAADATPAELLAAVEAALADQGMAV
jgi:hypothetical protein